MTVSSKKGFCLSSIDRLRMYGPPFTRSGRNATFLSPRPNFPKEPAIEPRTAQIMQQTGDLILADPLGSMPQCHGHRGTHARGPNRMGSIIPANDTTRLSRMWVIVKTHQPWQECAGNQKRGRPVGSSFHELGYSNVWITTDKVARRISFKETRCQGEPLRQRSMKVLISAMLGLNT